MKKGEGWEGGGGRKEQTGPFPYWERTRSSTGRHQDIRDFDRAARSTTAQSLFVSYPLSFHLPSSSSSSLLSFSLSFFLFVSPFLPPLFTWPVQLGPQPLSLSLSFSSQPLLSDLCCSTRGLSRPDLRASRLHVACPNDVSERTGTTAI